MENTYKCAECATSIVITTEVHDSEDEGIEFDEIDVNQPENEVEYANLSKITKSEDVPIVRVGKQLLVPNVSFRSIKEAAELTKKFLG